MNMSKISLGSVQFGTDYGVNSVNGQVKPDEVEKILRYAQSKDIDLLDTAPAYGSSEQILGMADVSNFKVITKTRHFGGHEISHNDILLLNDDLHNSLKVLKQESVYGILVHNAGDLLKPGGRKIFDQLQKFKQTGKVKKLGVSVYDSNELRPILDIFELDIVQLPLNIMDRRMIDNGMLSSLRSKNIEVHARSVFLQGLLLMTEENRPKKFNRWSALWKGWHGWLYDNRISGLEATIRYAISLPEISKVVVGVETVKQLKEIFLASAGVLPEIPRELSTEDPNLLNPSNWARL
jgi:aryl-alcohol dehydrogenase-like predicted oxidoreductase